VRSGTLFLMLVPTTHGQSRYLGVLAGKECKAHQQSVGLGSLFLLLVLTTHWAAGTSGFFAGQRVYTVVFFQARDIACKC